MIKVLVIDDEKKAVENLCLLLKEFCPLVSEIDVAFSGEEGIEKITKNKPALIFLDVQMPRMSGFKMLDQLPVRAFEVIFTTAHDQFAIEAFKINAVDYLLKPIEVAALKRATDKAIRQITSRSNESTALIEQLLSSLKKENSTDKIAISSQEGISYVPTAQVLYMSADSNYTHVYLVNGKKYTLAKTLKDVEESLPSNIFFRVHNATIVNLKHVDKYVRGDGGYVVLSNGTSLEVAKRRKPELLDRLG